MRYLHKLCCGLVIAIGAIVMGGHYVAGSDPNDLASILMRSTFKLEGGGSLGTAFVLGQPLSGDPLRVRYVLITAAHVLENMKGETATLHLRQSKGDGFARLAFPIPIRKGGTALWIRGPRADVAAMLVALPQIADLRLASTDLLATDDILREFEVRPGDQLLVLGFPFGTEANDAGFPILRSGRIASFPLVPTSTTMAFLLDFPVFPGNSGGPVFMFDSNRVYAGSTHIGTTSLLLGLVSQQKNVTETIRSLDQTLTKDHSLGIAVVVHASFIRDVMNQLPSPAPDALASEPK